MTSEDSTGSGEAANDRRARSRQIAGVLGLVLLVAVVLPFVVFTVPQAVGAEHSYVVLSGSMEPTISPGDVILVNGVSASAVERGDIINFARSGESRTTTHRVVEVVQRDGEVAFRTKGDNNEGPDQSLVSPGQLRGRVMSVGGHLLIIPLVGYVIRFAGTQTGFALLFIVPLSLLVANEVWNLVMASRRSESSHTGDTTGNLDTDAKTATESDVDNPVVTTDPDEPDVDAVLNLPSSGFDGEPSDEEADGPEDEEATVSMRASELELGIVVLGAFAVFSYWVAYTQIEFWSVGVAASVTVALVMLLGLYVFGGTDDPAGEGTDSGSGDDGDVVEVRTTGPPEELGICQPVASFGTLVELAAAIDSPIRRERNRQVHYVDSDRALYVHRGTPEGEWETLLESDDGTDEGSESEFGSESDDESDDDSGYTWDNGQESDGRAVESEGELTGDGPGVDGESSPVTGGENTAKEKGKSND